MLNSMELVEVKTMVNETTGSSIVVALISSSIRYLPGRLNALDRNCTTVFVADN